MLGGQIAEVLHNKAGEVVPVLLASDPAVSKANSEAVLEHYLETGDREELRQPEDATIVGLRVLTEEEMGTCYRRAGRISKLGEIINARMEGLSDADEVEALEKLTDTERRAMAYNTARQHRFMSLLLNTSVQSVSTCKNFEPGRAMDWVRTIGDMHVEAKVCAELFTHALRINTAGARGKASGPRSG